MGCSAQRLETNGWWLRSWFALALIGAGCGSHQDDPASTGAHDAGEREEGRRTSADAETLDLERDVFWGAYHLPYQVLHSAHDGEHRFQVPAYAREVDSQPEDWSSVPPGAVSFAAFRTEDGARKGVMITVERAVPEVELRVRHGYFGGRATLHITQATPEQWQIGRDRYLDGAPFDAASFQNDATLRLEFPALLEMLAFDADGEPYFTDVAERLGISTDLRCDRCHDQTSPAFQALETPTQAARFDDATLMRVLTQGEAPDDGTPRVLTRDSARYYAFMHTWAVTRAQATGLIVYLRSLPPAGAHLRLDPSGRGQPEFDQSLPPECNASAPDFDLQACMDALPEACRQGSPVFDFKLCRQMLGLDPEFD